MHAAFHSRRAFMTGLGATLAAPSLVRAATSEHLSGAAFGTRWHITGPEGKALGRLRPALDALFAEIDQDMSPWRPDSALSRFNTSQTGMPASSEMTRVARSALHLARESEGAFDPTVGPLVARWGFGPIEQGAAPDWRKLSVGQGRLAKSRADLTLDLCGIAKGRALDRAWELARDHGLANLLLDLGGELRALGPHPEGRDWHVAVEPPAPGHPVPAILHLPEGMAVATSGLGAQSYVLNGRAWGHIMNPANAQPVDGKLRSVTVLADDAMTADGWATALFAAGDASGPALARKHDIAALFVFVDAQALRQLRTGGIGAVLS